LQSKHYPADDLQDGWRDADVLGGRMHVPERALDHAGRVERRRPAGEIDEVHCLNGAGCPPCTTSTGSSRRRNEDLVEAGAATDRQNIRTYLDALGCGTSAEAAFEEERLQQELDELLSRLWPSVEPVTRALVQQGTIRYEEIRALVKGQKESSGQGGD
jgi:hypothetical protein